MGHDRASPVRHVQVLQVLGRCIRTEHQSNDIASILTLNFGAMSASGDEGDPSLTYVIRGREPPYSILRDGEFLQQAPSLGDLLFYLEKDLVVELQKQRADLLFLHSAAVEYLGKAYLLAAESGGGKSTTAFALLHHGFRYLSDELSPVDPAAMEVHGYPHALCVKQAPPMPYALPQEAVRLSNRIYIPTPVLPGGAVSGSAPLGGVFLVNYSPELRVPQLRRLSGAEAGARLYVTALNALAHEDRGLAPVLRIAEHVPCFAIATAQLPETCALIRSTVEQAGRCSFSNY
jgi:hypothetical protein